MVEVCMVKDAEPLGDVLLGKVLLGNVLLDNVPRTHVAARTLKTRAVYYLSRREYSRAELGKKLALPRYQPQHKPQHKSELQTNDGGERPCAQAIEAVLDDLQRQGFLNDARFAQGFLHRNAKKLGAGRIMAQLSQHQLDAHTLQHAAQQLKSDELPRCYAVWEKKFSHTRPQLCSQSRSHIDSNTDSTTDWGIHSDPDPDPEQCDALNYQQTQAQISKQGRFLMQRGFSADAVRQVLRGWKPHTE